MVTHGSLRVNSKSGQHLISPHSFTTELFIKIMRVKEMIANLRSFKIETNFLRQYQRKCVRKRKANMDTDVGENVKMLV